MEAMKYFLSYSVFFILLLVVKTSNAQTTLVSGTISLPQGVAAGPGGVEIELSGLFIEIDNQDSQQTVTILPGESSTNYSLSFNIDDQEIEFNCADCFDLGVTTEGSWNEINGVVAKFSGTEYLLGTSNNVDIVLESATRFNGLLLFPNDFAASGGEFVIITVVSAVPFALDFFSDSILLNEGDTSFEFSLGVPSDLSNTGWTLRAACPFDCDENLIFLDDNFATAISGDPTTLDPDQAFVFPTGGSFTNLNVTLQGPFIEPPQEQDNVAIPPILNLLLDEEE